MFFWGGHLYKWRPQKSRWHTKRVSLDLPRLHKQLMPHKNKLAFPWLEQTQIQTWQELSKSQLAGLTITARFSIHHPASWLYCRKERHFIYHFFFIFNKKIFLERIPIPALIPDVNQDAKSKIITDNNYSIFSVVHNPIFVRFREIWINPIMMTYQLQPKKAGWPG